MGGARAQARREEAAIDVEDFATIFGDGGVRVLLDWSALPARGFAVRERFTRSREVLGDLMTVWYALADGATAEYHTTGARPLSVRSALGLRARWPQGRDLTVARLTRALREQGDPVQLVLPALEVPGGPLILLDGTHRACAAFVAGVDLRILLYCLTGPVDPSVLPDVSHHAGPRAA